MKCYRNYDKYPSVEVPDQPAWEGYFAIGEELKRIITEKKIQTLVLDCYPEVDQKEVHRGLKELNATWFFTDTVMLDPEAYHEKIQPFLTDDRVFGIMNTMTLADVTNKKKADVLRCKVEDTEGIRCVIGVGASRLVQGDCLIYLDLARWEIQCRFAKGLPNWNSRNSHVPKLAKFKQGYFVEWRMADRHKRTLLDKADYLLDTNIPDLPKMITGAGWRQGMDCLAHRPFRLVPYFAPEVWGGGWMKEVCDLDRSAPNYAWAFDGVPEENSVFLTFGSVRVEIPSIDVVFYRPQALLGDRVHARFGDEYPIRFDFLDTMGGQNLSLQVHPTTEYIQHTFGMHYTQDESYYILDCEEGAHVYLGLKEGVDREKMLAALTEAQEGNAPFPADDYVNCWLARKHDHFLIPAGTVHCSGAGTMVLEISATPYIFTFKLWDWSRLGLDGLPRPVHLDHGRHVIQWERTTSWIRENCLNRFETLTDTEGFKEERTGLHPREFIETRRCCIRTSTLFTNDDSVVQANVVDGRGAVIESPTGAFPPFEVHYAETFIVPASVGSFTVRPLDDEVVLLKASVRG